MMLEQSMMLVVGLLVLAVIVAFVLPASQKAAAAATVIDPFSGYSGIPQIDDATRDDYIDRGSQLYNRISETNDVTRGGFVGTDDPIAIRRADDDIQAATRTSYMEQDGNAPTKQGVRSERMNLRTVPGSPLFIDSKKCESLRGRSSCAKLGTPGFETCGVCIKGGTAYTDPDNAGKHIGGLVVLPEDRTVARDAAKATGKYPSYFPTVGDCPEGYFFVDRNECEKQVNRLDCKEAGETGGFNNGRNIEGTVVGPTKCAQVPIGGNNAFIYDTKNRRFNVNLRVLTPIGTGICKVIVTNSSGTQVGYGMSDTPGKDFTVTILNAAEGDRLNVRVVEEAPYRVSGKQEIFQYAANPNGTSIPGYMYGSAEDAKNACERIGAQQATEAQLNNMQQMGGQLCSAGWAKGFAGYPMQTYEKRGWCGTGRGVQRWGTGRAHAWCYGAKPPSSINNFFATYISPWFDPIGNAEPSQEDMPRVLSQHGADYVAPSQRAVLMQWESLDGARKVPFEPTIQALNGVRADGGAIKVLRRFGTFNGSKIILSPRPAGIPTMMSNMFWWWSNQSDSQQLSVEAQVPGTFLNPVYAEDNAIAYAGPIVTKPETMDLLKTNACLAADQRPGAYSSECLTILYKSAGGDIYNGKMAKEGLDKLNAIGDMDAISGYLSELYNLATKGKSTSGMRASATEINDAAQKLFGFDIVTPCEDISEDAGGNIILTPKVGGLDAECLDYLWMNTGNDRNRGNEDLSRRTSVKNTFTSIADRFSGLRSSEGTKAGRAAAPFAACQKKGTLAPISETGRVNNAAIAIANSKGSIDNIQRFYDTIHKDANYKGGNMDTAAVHAKAVEQCYGITAAKEPPPPSCGVKARYVRVLRSHIAANDIKRAMEGPNEVGQSNIQIPQIQVFSSDGKEVARGKPVSNASECCGGNPGYAVNGDARPKSHGEGEYHDGVGAWGPVLEYWMVDLQGEFDIQKIVYYLRTDCCTGRQYGTPIQLLNSSKQIVAEKNLGSSGTFAAHIPQVLMFSAADTRPKIPIDALVPETKIIIYSGTGVNLQFANTRGEEINVINMEIYPDTGAIRIKNWINNSAAFVIAPANNRKPGFISLRSFIAPKMFVRHAGFRMYLHNFDNSNLFAEDSSFKIVPALNGDPTMVSFESSNFPGRYICTDINNAREVWLAANPAPHPFDQLRACWRINKPQA